MCSKVKMPRLLLLCIFTATLVLLSAHDHGHHHGGHDHHHGGHGHHHGSHGHHHGGHGHDHGHHHEDPRHRYSKEANMANTDHHHPDHRNAPPGHGGDPKVQEEKLKNKHTPDDSSRRSSQAHAGSSHSYEQPASSKKAPVLWIEPLLATAAISAAPFLILFLVPLDSNSVENQPFLKMLLAFASGGLLGDAFLHLIPHAISPHAHDGSELSSGHGHSHAHHDLEHVHDHTGDMVVGLWVLGGMVAFLVVEKCVRHIKGSGHSHSHSHSKPKSSKKEDQDANKAPSPDVGKAHVEDTDKVPEKSEANTSEKDSSVRKRKLSGGRKIEGTESKDSTDVSKEDEIAHIAELEGEIRVSAYLNLAADCTHNFTDGLAIAASFLVNRNVGLITTLTIFLHEIPHEIGDFAILVQSGCSKRKAMSLQLVTAIGAFAGCLCGLLAEGLGTAAVSWILPFTAGGFIYIATVSVIPELLEETKLTQSVKEIAALLVGVFLMVVIAVTE